MRIVIASCSVIYSGRGDTKLNKAVRAIMLKEDGSISIHNDKSNKPLNYMGKGNVFTETFENAETVWTFDTSRESLQIRLHEIVSETVFDVVEEDEGLICDGTENQLQAWIAENPEVLGKGFTFVDREYQTGDGPVDILVLDAEGNPVAVEVKRIATLNAVGQIMRYVAALKEQPGFEKVRGILTAVDVRPKTAKLAKRREIECVLLPSNWKTL